MIDKQAKARAIAEFLEGQIVDDSQRVEICIKGSILGFPATLEALRSHAPFGVTYIVETNVATGANDQKPRDSEELTLQIMPRYATGIFAFVTRILLFESKGHKIGDKRFDSRYVTTLNDSAQAERFITYPGVIEKIEKLSSYTKFNEIGVRVGAGIYLGQGKSFNGLDVDVCKETFKLLGDLSQVIFESFESH